jgi:hypothetical protein
VIISQSPDVIVYTKDERDHIVKKEVLLTGWRGVDYDHGVHAVVFGPDGRYYLNNGDPGFDITDRSGHHFVGARSGPYYAACETARGVSGEVEYQAWPAAVGVPAVRCPALPGGKRQ